MAKILVIDDDPAMRRTLVRMLAAEDHQVVEAGDGLAGMKRFHAERPDLVITDIVMPEREGIETIREIRGSGIAALIVAISGGSVGSGDMYLRFADQLGADAVLAKPFRPAELLTVVKNLLSAR